MISVSAPTGSYILQPSLVEMHRKSLDWLSATLLWQREIVFFQKLLDGYSQKYSSIHDKKQIDHFQNLIIYYSGELVVELRKKLRLHESRMAQMLQEKNESDAPYYQEHRDLMGELSSFNDRYNSFKHELFDFIELAM